ncbi:DNA polymerase III subunit gamma/tau [Bifidobacterium thermophilum]|uniref:DNA polymerase III subunit gamma/tau n=1 Tax=Bifidobacterium thermophilum TaxID=33905 RepID=UPI0030B66D0E
MALALYRRYRPDTFDGVIGQDQVTIPLSRALDQNRLTHAYLFSGPRGCGKTSSARILARCVNCVKGPTSHPCGECPSCKDLATGGPGSIDVVEIDAASHNGVDDARELRERAGFAPARDRYKIFILDEAHMVTQQGFNALLKIVEEPPEHVMFIFATTEPDKVIGTIRSRTHHYPFRLVPPEIMGPYLERICDKEQIRPEPGVLKLAMRAGGGSVRDTLSVLDQLMVGSQNGVISHDSAIALLGFTPDSLVGEAIDAIIDRDGEQLYGVVQKVVVGGFEPRRFVEDLLARVRDLLVLTLGGERAESVLSDDAAVEDIADLHRQAEALGLHSLTAIADTINDALGAMAGATSPRMRLELLAARLLAGREEHVFGTSGTPAAAAGQTGAASPQADGPAVRTGFIDSSRNKHREQAPARRRDVDHASEVSPVSGSSGASGQDPRQQPATVAAQSPAPAPTAAGAPAASPASPAAPAAAASSASIARSVEERWQEVLNALPSDVREYVGHEQVPSVRLLAGPAGKSKLLMTFARPIDQHAFALAVSSDEAYDGRKASIVVQDVVRQVFGEGAHISPTPTAANGETVESIRRMSPEQVSQVKREIALARAKQSAATLAAVTVGMHGASGKETKTPAQADGGAQDPDDPGHRGHTGVSAAAASAPVAVGIVPEAPAPAASSGQMLKPDQMLDEDDPWMQPLPVPGSAQQGTAQPGASQSGSSAQPDTPTRSAAQSSGSSVPPRHHGKHVAVPDISDGIDPWAVPSAPAAAAASPGNTQGRAGTGMPPADIQARSAGAPQDAGDVWQAVPAQAHTPSQPFDNPQDMPDPVEPPDDPWARQPDDFGAADPARQTGSPAAAPVPPEEDEYSLNDESLGTATALSVDELKELFEVKTVEQFAPDDPKNPKNLQPPNRRNDMNGPAQQ